MHRKTSTMKNNEIYQKITDSIINNMSTDSWQKMWKTPHPVSLAGHLYQGVNQMLLGFSEFQSPVWGSFKQIREAGGQVNKGEKGTFVIFTKTLRETDDAGNENKIWYLRYYYIFNSDQCTWTEKGQVKVNKLSQGCNSEVTRSRSAEEIIENMPNRPIIEHSQQARPSYCPAIDTVRMPNPGQFNGIENYFRSMFHELVHASGHPSRLNRELAGFSEETAQAYSKEELVAELGAAYLNVISENPVSLDVSASYINHWKKVLSDNTDWIIWAASKASRAVNYILNIEQQVAPPEETETETSVQQIQIS